MLCCAKLQSEMLLIGQDRQCISARCKQAGCVATAAKSGHICGQHTRVTDLDLWAVNAHANWNNYSGNRYNLHQKHTYATSASSRTATIHMGRKASRSPYNSSGIRNLPSNSQLQVSIGLGGTCACPILHNAHVEQNQCSLRIINTYATLQ